jgi:flavin reductase (DIM6/NTAB) family NADH-FMN oxidoreductase RutF
MTVAPDRTQSPVAPEEFMSFMSGFPTGVSVITVLEPDGSPRGMTCSSLCAVTLSPPTVLVCLRLGSPTLDAILRRRSFALNILHDGAEKTAVLFASGAPHRFELIRWEHGPRNGNPHLCHAADAIADCRVVRAEQVSDHTVVYGEVMWLSHDRDHHPLLRGLRQYRAWPAR